MQSLVDSKAPGNDVRSTFLVIAWKKAHKFWQSCEIVGRTQNTNLSFEGAALDISSNISPYLSSGLEQCE